MTLLQKHLVFVPLFFVAYIVCFGGCVMLLWNWLMPTLLGLPSVTFWQAAGLLLLCKILFGGIGSAHHGHGHHGCHHGTSVGKLRERWENMTPEERERIAKAHGQCLHAPQESNPTIGTDGE